jgi:hypothetical protein
VQEINVSRTGDPVHAGDKTLMRETPVQGGGGLTGMLQLSWSKNPDLLQILHRNLMNIVNRANLSVF